MVEAGVGGRVLAGLARASVAVALVRGRDQMVAWANPAFCSLVTRPITDVPVDAWQVPGLVSRIAEVAAGGGPVRDAGRLSTLRAGSKVGAGSSTEPAERVAALSLAPVPITSDTRSAAITDLSDVVADILVVAIDVTAETLDQRSTRRQVAEQQLLDSATVALHDANDPADELTALTRSLVPAFADACSAIMLDNPVRPGVHDGRPLLGTRVSFAAVQPDVVDYGDDERETPAERTGLSWGAGASVLHEAVRTGRPALSPVPFDAESWSDTGGSVDWLRASGIRALAAAPIRVQGTVVGLLGFASGPNRPPFGRADLSVMDRIAARAGVVVGQSLTFQRQREASLTLQRSMLTSAPIVPGLEVVTRYRPTVADDEVGGDWYDAFALPTGDLAVAIGDVAGHDLTSAATMGQLRSMLRALAHDRDAGPGEIVTRLDRVACGLDVTDFTSLVLGRLRRGAEGTWLSWSNAGHPPPLLIDATGRPQLVEHPHGPGPVLGVLPDARRPTSEIELLPGATLLLYTDGLVERRGSDPDANVVTLVEQATLDADGSLDGLCDALVRRAPVDDDVAVLAVRLLPDAPAPS